MARLDISHALAQAEALRVGLPSLEDVEVQDLMHAANLLPFEGFSNTEQHAIGSRDVTALANLHRSQVQQRELQDHSNSVDDRALVYVFVFPW